MKLFLELTSFEFKKTMCRKRTIIVLALVIIVGALSVFGTVIGTYSYTDENGNEIVVSRYEDDIIDRKNGEALSDRVINANLIMEAVDAYKRVPLENGKYINNSEYQNYARKYSDIYNIVRKTLNLSGVEDFQNLTRQEAEKFDEIRLSNLEKVIENSETSENMRKYWLKCLDASPVPLTFEYSGGYDRFVAIMYTTAIMVGAAIAIIFSGIFSGEYANGADSLILSSKHGKGLVIKAKLFTAFSISAALIVLLAAISYAECMIVWGTNGANGALELIGNVFPYPITIGEAALLYFVCMLTASVMFAAITSLFSAKLKLPFNTIIIMIALLIVPMFINIPDEAPNWVFCLENLLPTNMFAFWGAMYDFQYEIFGLVIPPYIFLPIFSIIITCLCSYFAGRSFKKHQIN